MREAQSPAMLGQSRRELGVRQQTVVLSTHPRRQVHFVHQHGLTHRIGVGPLREPGTVVPLIRVAVLHDRCMPGPRLHANSIRIRLDAQRPRGRLYLELIQCTIHDTGHEEFEHPTRAQQSHRMRASVPLVERTDHRHAHRVRRPDRERRPFNTIDHARMRTELLPQPEVPSLTEQVEVHLSNRGQEPVRVIALHHHAIGEGKLQAIRHRNRSIAEEILEQPMPITFHGPALITKDHGDRIGVRVPRANDHAVNAITRIRMRAKQVVRMSRGTAHQAQGSVSGERRQCHDRKYSADPQTRQKSDG